MRLDILMPLFHIFTECESLVRKMLVRDPAKRYTLSMVRRHPWMRVEVPQKVLVEEEEQKKKIKEQQQHILHEGGSNAALLAGGHCGGDKLLSKGQQSLNEQVLRVMQSLGIDPSRTTEVIGIYVSFLKKITCIYC